MSFFTGYSATFSSDADTMSYASRLEPGGQDVNLYNKLRVTPALGLQTAGAMTATAFREAMVDAVKAVYGFDGTYPDPIEVEFHNNDGGWLIHDMVTGSPWRTRFWYFTPPTNPATWKKPVLIIADVSISAMGGRPAPRYTGENVAQFMAWDNHPVMMIALAGMEPYVFGGWYGMHPVYQFDSYMNMRGSSAMSVWVRDAYVAASLLEDWHPGKTIGVIGVSKSGIPAATTALLHSAVDQAYIASTFTMFEETFGAGSEFSYGSGERVQFARVALPLALNNKGLRLSYSALDDVQYRVETNEHRLLNALNAIRTGWSAPAITQFDGAPFHYFNQADVTAFFP